MSTTTFDTLGFARRLQELGFTQTQAEGFAQLQREMIDERLVTKDYLDKDNLATKQDMKDLGADIKADMKDLEYRLTIRLGGMVAASVAIVAALVKLT